MPGKIDASLNEKLASVEWGEYKINEFTIPITIKRKLTKEDCLDNGTYPVYASDTSNSGIVGYTDYPEFILNNGEQYILFGDHTRTMNIPYKNFSVCDNVKVLKVKLEHIINSKRCLIFIMSAWKKVIPNLRYARHWKIAKDVVFQLPTKCGKIDFNFMESFIADLEDQRIADLESYLSITGLKDYELTEKEEKVIQEFKQGKIMFDNFTIQSLFNHIKQGKRLKKDDQIEGSLPFVMSGVGNTGIVGYISNSVEVFPENSITIDIFGNVFYRNYLFGAGDDTGVYWNDNKCYSKKMMLFLASSISRALYGKYSYGKKLRSSQSRDIKITLPMKNNKPDFEFMELFISAIQKLVIKDVVDYADNKIYATKQVIDKK